MPIEVLGLETRCTDAPPSNLRSQSLNHCEETSAITEVYHTRTTHSALLWAMRWRVPTCLLLQRTPHREVVGWIRPGQPTTPVPGHRTWPYSLGYLLAMHNWWITEEARSASFTCDRKVHGIYDMFISLLRSQCISGLCVPWCLFIGQDLSWIWVWYVAEMYEGIAIKELEHIPKLGRKFSSPDIFSNEGFLRSVAGFQFYEKRSKRE